jgi:hypothetical protein
MIRAKSVFSQDIESARAARELAERLRQSLGSDGEFAAVIVYATVHHDQRLLLETLAGELGERVALVGSSTQGVMTRGRLEEQGFVLGALGLGGVAAATAIEEEIQEHTTDKGRALGRRLKAGLAAPPRAVVLLWDPLCGVDAQLFLEGLQQEISGPRAEDGAAGRPQSCPVVGGAAGQPWGKMIQTFQYHGARVTSHAAVALALGGALGVEVGMTHGTTPTGVTSVVTRAERNVLLEIDGRPALEVLREMTGCAGPIPSTEENSSWAIGVPRPGAAAREPQLVRAVFGFDRERQGVVLQAAIAEQSRIMFHHRTVASVLGGSREMAAELRASAGGRRVVAALGFECAARTAPFLGAEAALAENVELQQAVAPEAEWLGMVAWGEAGPCGEGAGFHNYSYPLLALLEV